MSSTPKKKDLKPTNLREVSSPGRLTTQVDRVRRLEAQLDALLQKMDLDTGIADTDYESTIEAIK